MQPDKQEGWILKGIRLRPDTYATRELIKTKEGMTDDQLEAFFILAVKHCYKTGAQFTDTTKARKELYAELTLRRYGARP